MGLFVERLVKVSIVHRLREFISWWELPTFKTRPMPVIPILYRHWGPDLAAQRNWTWRMAWLATFWLLVCSILEESLSTRSRLKLWSIQLMPEVMLTRLSGHTLLRSL